MKLRLAAVVTLAALAAGCGGGGGGSSSSDAADVVPADALAYAAIDTDTSSAQVSSALDILDKFPIKARAERQLRASISRSGLDIDAITKTAGPEVDVAVLMVNGKPTPVGFAKPSDEKTFDAQLDKGGSKHTTIDGWTVFGDQQAELDAVKNRTANLADDAAFQAAMKTVPAAGDSIASFYASSAGTKTALGAAKNDIGPQASSLGTFISANWAAGALSSQEGAFKLEVHAKTASTTSAPSGNALVDQIPSGAIVALAIQGGGAVVPASAAQQLSAVGQQLGIDLPALVSALNGPVIAYVRPGIPLPEITIAARPTEPQRAATAVGGLLARIAKGAKGVPTPVDGGTLTKIDLGPIALYYGVNNGQLVVTDSANALAELKGSVGQLSGDSVFKEAKDGAGMTDGGQGFVYVDIKDALPALSGFAQLANQTLPPAAEANLRPLRSLLLFGSREGGVQSFVAYVKTS